MTINFLVKNNGSFLRKSQGGTGEIPASSSPDFFQACYQTSHFPDLVASL